MCIAILNKSGFIPDQHIQNSFDNNYDGAGLAWIESGIIKTYKTMNDISEFIQTYKKIRKNNDSPILLHFRISTHGKVNISNVHPFMIGNKMAMIHNGMIDFPILNKNLSDTHSLVLLLNKLSNPENIHDSNSVEFQFIKETCDNHSKMVFLSADSKYTIFNEEKGHWIDQTWYSNYTYKDYGRYDFGGKSMDNLSKSNQYSFDSYKNEYAWDEYEMDEIETFANLHEIDPYFVDDFGVDWDDPESWEIENWIYLNGMYYLKSSYEFMMEGA